MGSHYRCVDDALKDWSSLDLQLISDRSSLEQYLVADLGNYSLYLFING
jgi:hypothetical protein